MNKIIVDTSAWIESFRPDGDAKLKERVKNSILEGEILLFGIIRTEILRGTKSSKEYNMMSELLRGLNYLSVEEDFWDRLSRFSFDLFRKGVIVPLTDTYIALLAIENNVSVLHQDKHFNIIAQKTSLNIVEVK
jgi:predicted nucleic acid-binding protein